MIDIKYVLVHVSHYSVQDDNVVRSVLGAKLHKQHHVHHIALAKLSAT